MFGQLRSEQIYPTRRFLSRTSYDEFCLSRRREPDSEAFRNICHHAWLRSAEASEREPNIVVSQILSLFRDALAVPLAERALILCK
jgi:hypothetical protein